MKENLHILVVDDEKDYSRVLSLVLKEEGHRVDTCQSGKEALCLLQKNEFDLVISDLVMPEMNGVELLKQTKKIYPGIYFIILTAFGTIQNAVDAMKYGAFTYVVKGDAPDELLNEVEHIRHMKIISEEDSQNKDPNHFYLQTKNPGFNHILTMSKKVAKSNANVLLLGESGVGKEVIAKYIHQLSNRSEELFVATNCHAFSDNLLESELFGHEKGSFTGAMKTRIGRFEVANKGCLFLDEIGDISLPNQAKLLRAIESKCIQRIGSNKDIEVDFRLISATNKVLEDAIAQGLFREDLFYRISTIIIQIPSLRHRKEDIPDLIHYFVNKICAASSIEPIEIPSDVLEVLTGYHYPGNIRELKNIVERMVVLSPDGKVDIESISDILMPSNNQHNYWDDLFFEKQSLKEFRNKVEAEYIKAHLEKNANNVSETAKKLGITPRHLFNKISEYNIQNTSKKEKDDFSEE